MNYEKHMRLAIEIACQNPQAPFGSVIVQNESEQIVATGVNQSQANPLLHGEIDAINHGARQSAISWEELTLFTTAEPCCMCQAAIVWAGISRVVYGTSVRTLTELGWRQFDLSAQDVVDSAKFSKCSLIKGVLEEECDQLFQQAK